MFQGPKGYIDKYVKYTCSMETVQQNGRFTPFSSKFPSNIYILFSLLQILLDSLDRNKTGLFQSSCVTIVTI